MKSAARFLASLLLSVVALKTGCAEPLVIPLWPEGVPGFKADAPPESIINDRFTKVHHATLTLQAPPVAESSGVAVIVSPSGDLAKQNLIAPVTIET